MTKRVWLFDLDNTLHDAGAWVFAQMNDTMQTYVVDTLGVTPAEADALRDKYWRRYGSTMLGLLRHHDVSPAHFLRETHRFPGLEQRVTGHRHDLAAIARLRGRRIVLTNAPRAYAMRVLGALGIVQLFDEVLSIEDMRMFGDWRPSPTAGCCARSPCGWACIRRAACWWRIRWTTCWPRAASACSRSGCSASPAVARTPGRGCGAGASIRAACGSSSRCAAWAKNL